MILIGVVLLAAAASATSTTSVCRRSSAWGISVFLLSGYTGGLLEIKFGKNLKRLQEGANSHFTRFWENAFTVCIHF